MTDLASLRIEVDSRSVPQGVQQLDKLTASGTRAEVAVDKLGDTSQQTGRQMRTASQAAAEMAAAAQKSASSAVGMGNSSKLASHQVQNLTFQLNDMFVGLASGQKPMTVFMQQGAQIAQIMQQAGVGVGGLAKELGGMVAGFARAHPIITAVAAAAAAAGASMGIVSAAMNSTRKQEIDAFKDSLGLTRKELKELGDVGITIGDVFVGTWRYIKEGLELDKVFKAIKEMAVNTFGAMAAAAKAGVQGIFAAFVAAQRGISAVWSDLPAIIGEAAVGAANVAIKAINWLLVKATTMLNAWIGGINGILEMVGFGKIGAFSAPQLEQLANPFSGAGQKAGQAFASGFSEGWDIAGRSLDQVGSKWGDHIFKAMKDRVTKEARDKGMLDDDAAKKAGGRAGKKAGEEFGKNFMMELARSLILYQEDVSAALKKTLDAQDAAGWSKFMEGVQKEAGKGAEAIERAANDNEAWNEQLRETVRLFDQIGGMAGPLGDVLSAFIGLRTGDYSGVGGPAGALLQTFGNIQWTGTKDGERFVFKLGEEFANVLDGVFGGNGTFFQALQGAGTGAAVSQIVGNGSKGSQLGGMLGGALGQAAGSQLFGSVAGFIGKAAGPVGAVVGAIAGSLLGGLFKKTPTGSVILGQGGVMGTSGNGGRDASGLGSSVLQSLDSIAKALGVTATGNYSVSVGMRGDTYRVDTTGRGRTKESDVLNFGSDAQAAVKAAIKDAIQDGVFEGLSQGMKDFILSGDLETQLGKVSAFKSALDAADQAKDPQAYELKALDKARTEILDIAGKVGASLEEITKLEDYYANQRKEIVDKYGAEALELSRTKRGMEAELLRLSGDEIGYLAAARALEREQLDPSLHALYDMIAAKQDEIAANEKLKVIADERAGLEQRYLQLTGDTTELRRRELDALDPTNRALLQMIFNLEDMKDAAEKAAEIGRQSRGLSLRLAEATGNTTLAEQIKLGDFLDQFDQSLHSMAVAVWEAEKAAEAAATRQANRQARSQEFASAQEALAERFQHRAQAANDNLTKAYEDQSSALKETIDQFTRFRNALKDFRDELFAKDVIDPMNASRGRFDRTATLAGMGDIKALEALPGVGRDYLDAFRGQTSSLLEYQLEAARVAQGLSPGIGAADARINDAQAQLDALERLNATNEEMRDEMKGMRTDIARLDANQRQSNDVLRKQFNLLDDWTEGGTAPFGEAA